MRRAFDQIRSSRPPFQEKPEVLCLSERKSAAGPDRYSQSNLLDYGPALTSVEHSLLNRVQRLSRDCKRDLLGSGGSA